MRKILAIAAKELQNYFHSPFAYVILIAVLSIFNLFFFIILDQNQEATLRDIFKVMEFLFVFIVPLLTMKLLAEEKLVGTLEFLQTTPTTNKEIILGKYLGSLILFSSLLVLTLAYYGILEFFGRPDFMASLSGYLGLWLEGALFIAIGLLASSWTRNQVLAAVSSYVILFFLYFSISFIKYFSGSLEGIIRYLGTWSHVENLSAGIITSADLVYYLSGIVLFLSLTRLSLKPKNVSLKNNISVVLFISLWIFCWAAVNFTAYTYNQRWDLTKFKTHTLSSSTKEILQNLPKDVKMTAFTVGIPPKYLEDLLSEYELHSQGKITTEIVDPLVQLSYAAEFGTVVNSRESKAIVQSGAERKDIDFTEVPLSESQLSNAIIQVTRKPRHIYFLTGHGEYNIGERKETGLSIFAQLLSANNAQARDIALGIQGSIPQDCDLLVVAGPKNFLTPQEEDLIREYLRKGGDAFFLIEHTLVTTEDKPLSDEELKKNPSLNNILNEWGVNIADDVVVDLTSHAGDDVGCPATRNYLPHKALLKDLDYTFYIRPRSISIVKDRRSRIKVVPFVLTASDEKASWGETNRTLQIKFDEGLDRPGPVPISSVVLELKEETDSSDTRLIVFTDADFLTNAYINHYTNAQMGLNIVGWLTEMETQVLIPSKPVEVERLDLTSQQKKYIAIILFGLLFLIAAIGFVVRLKK